MNIKKEATAMKERILESLKAKSGIEILEQHEEGDVFAVHYRWAGKSRWDGQVHGYACVKGEKVLGKANCDGSGSTASQPMPLSEFLNTLRGAGSL
jgi:hypothetical protein